MHSINSLKDLISTLANAKELLHEMFEKRKSFSFSFDQAAEVVDSEEKVSLFINKGILRQNGPVVEIEEVYREFFEQVLEVNEEISTANVHESITQVKENIDLYLMESKEGRKYNYLKAAKNALRKIGRITRRNIIDLNRNIENTFKTEPNYKIKIKKLENFDQKRKAIRDLIIRTEILLDEEEHTFFRTAIDVELSEIIPKLKSQLIESRHNLIETETQIIEYLNQIRLQSRFLEHLRQVKYLKDQFLLEGRTNIVSVLSGINELPFEQQISYPLKVSMDIFEHVSTTQILQKLWEKAKTKNRLILPLAERFSTEDLDLQVEEASFINLEEIRDGFRASGDHLFNFIMRYPFTRPQSLAERVTLFVQVVSLYDQDFELTDQYISHQSAAQEIIEYVKVFPK